jgi:hypothetical protein
MALRRNLAREAAIRLHAALWECPPIGDVASEQIRDLVCVPAAPGSMLRAGIIGDRPV